MQIGLYYVCTYEQMNIYTFKMHKEKVHMCP